MLCAIAVTVLAAATRAATAGAGPVRWKIPMGQGARTCRCADSVARGRQSGGADRRRWHQRRRGGRLRAVLPRQRHPADLLRQRHQHRMVGQRTRAAAHGGLRADSAGQPHLVTPGHHPPQPGRRRRSDQPKRRFPSQHLRGGRHPVFPPALRRHTADIDKVAADLGYATITMWSGDLGDWTAGERNHTRRQRARSRFSPNRS